MFHYYIKLQRSMKMNRPRKQTYTMDMYLNKIKDLDIRNDSDTQRQFVWSNEQVNELIVTILSEDYIPPIILAEVDNSQLWIVDGGQRSSSFNKFKSITCNTSIFYFHIMIKEKIF